ncbi:MAG: hypothetical protein ACLTYI_05965 [Christensenellales bacterium]
MSLIISKVFMPSFLSLFRRKENRKEAKEREKPNPFIMKKKQGKGKSPTLTDIFLKGYNK